MNGTPQKYSRESVLCLSFALIQVVAFWTWHLAMPNIVDGNIQNWRVLAAPVALLVLAAALFGLATLLVRSRTLLSGVMIAAGLLPFAFSFPSSALAWLVPAGTVIFLLLGASNIHREVGSSIKFQISKLLKAGLGSYFTATALILSLFYLNRIENKDVLSILLPQPLFDLALRAFSGTIQSATGLPRIRPDQTVNDVIREVVRAQLQAQGVSLDRIPKQEFNRMLATQRDEIASSFDLKVTGEERVGVLLSRAAVGKAREIVGAYNRYLPLGAAIAFFFTVKALSILLYLLAAFLAMLLMKLLILVRMVEIQKEQVEAERFVL